MAQSTTEAEYIVTLNFVNQTFWRKKITTNLRFQSNNATEILCDNKSALARIKYFMVKQNT